MSQLAGQYGAINLSQGFPNFPVDERLKAITAKWAKAEIHQYMPMAGYGPLLEKIAALTAKSYGRTVDPATEILVTAGATEAIFATIQALVERHDEVIILDPSYDCYETPVILCGAKSVRIALKDDFTPDWTRIGDAMNAKTRMIIINNPHNPSGRIWTLQDFEVLEQLLERYPKVVVLSDEVYEYITFGRPHISVNQREKLKDRSICISSFGKSFHITGWKIGYVIASQRWLVEIKKVHQFMVFSVNSIAQYAINEYLDIVAIDELSDFYEQKRNRFRSLLKTSKFELLPCEGTYFQVASYAAISDENDLDFTRRLTAAHGVAAIPLSPFYQSARDLKLVRFCFAKDNETLQAAAAKLLLL